MKDEDVKLKPRICPRCNSSNQYDVKFCSRCGLALDVKVAQELEGARKKTDNIMDVLMKDKEFKELLIRKMKEHGLA